MVGGDQEERPCSCSQSPGPFRGASVLKKWLHGTFLHPSMKAVCVSLCTAINLWEVCQNHVQHTETFMVDCPRVFPRQNRLTSTQKRRLRDLNRRHLGEMVSRLKVQDTVFIDGEHFTEVKRSYLVMAVGTERH